ncbi:unnamed protein product [Sphagnum jensenii]|uniref:Uncharacterized protein n=1 Tax=Sphagnum jensenii TaxID=128206 RepID=A0ABP1BRM5_9BRYO
MNGLRFKHLNHIIMMQEIKPGHLRVLTSICCIHTRNSLDENKSQCESVEEVDSRLQVDCNKSVHTWC